MTAPVQIKVRAGNSVYEARYSQDGNMIEVRIDDRGYNVDACRIHEGFFSILVDGRSVETVVTRKDGRFTVGIKGGEYVVEFFDPRARKYKAETGKPAAEGVQRILAPMAGRIVSLLVKKGDVVKEGAGLVILEAMKMENKILSQGDGKVTDVLVTDTDTVESGQPLMVIDMSR